MSAFWAALQFLTRLPTPTLRRYDHALAGRSALYFPLVGLMLGLLLWGTATVLAPAPPGVRAALVLIVWVVLSGGLHLDGLGDSADAWLGGHGDRERSLAIMRDPRAGSAAVIAIALVLMAKYAALEALLARGAEAAPILAVLWGRTAALALLLWTPSAREDGFGAVLGRHMPRRPALLAILAASILPLGALGWTGLWLLSAVVVVGLGLRRLMMQRLGGANGDTAGALVEITEVVTLAGLCMI